MMRATVAVVVLVLSGLWMAGCGSSSKSTTPTAGQSSPAVGR